MAGSAVRVRFVFNQKTGAVDERVTRQRFGKDLATTLVERMAFRAGEAEYDRIKNDIAKSFERDAKVELNHIAALYRRHIIGASAGRSKPSGMLGYAIGASDTGVGDDDNEISIAESLPDWAPRSGKYLLEKKRRNWSKNWFTATGYLNRTMRGPTLLSMFGPIRVTITRNLKANIKQGANVGTKFGGSIKDEAAGGGGRVFNGGGSGSARLNIATVRVFAMSSITPAMLPALRDGNAAAMNPSSGNEGLYNLMKAVDPRFAASVSGFSSVATGHRYRPTLEPFLAFYLTRSLPNALALRLQEGQMRAKRRRVT